MSELERHVEGLFKGYKNTREVKELKEEILSNLEAKVSDYVKNGMYRDDAVEKALKGLDSVDHLIGNKQKIYINRFRIEVWQTLLVYMLIAWIATIPLRFLRSGIVANSFLTLAVAVFAVVYLIAYSKKDEEYLSTVSDIDVGKLTAYRKWAWIIWCIYIDLMVIYNTGIHFASNIWFHRAVRIDGPYQFASIAADYLIPAFTIVIPLVINRLRTLAEKYGAGE